jgi:L-galactose dehydrogenase
MDTVVLGRTGLEVSVAGLGCGGHSRLGQATGATEEESVRLVQRALELGVTYIDTARAYGTEEIVGRGLAGQRDQVVVSTKAHPQSGGGPLTPRALRESVQLSLRRLGTDRVDVFHLHGVDVELYEHCLDELVPELQRLRSEGAVRFLAISERFGADPGHTMLQRAMLDDCWDVAMVGFNLLNPSARDRVFPLTQDKNIGVEVMFAVRRTLSQPDELRRVARQLVEESHIAEGAIDLDDPVGFLLRPGRNGSVVESAYRFARHEPGCHVVLTGTGNLAHLEDNISSINSQPLTTEEADGLRRLFGHLDHLSGN